jgi:hypothetical protein
MPEMTMLDPYGEAGPLSLSFEFGTRMGDRF